MAAQLITHIDTPFLALIAVCVGVLGVVALPWRDAEVQQTAVAMRAAVQMGVQWLRGADIQPRVQRVRALPARRAVRFARSL
ncbi:MAG: hypothetical protein EP330_02075 [Deltaproteobacteria bacterium]|nr:MAG: hypothetical protein EP330_02075 [Deltaproteobacteria bacterium]